MSARKIKTTLVNTLNGPNKGKLNLYYYYY